MNSRKLVCGQTMEQMKTAMLKINIRAYKLLCQDGVFSYPLILEFGTS